MATGPRSRYTIGNFMIAIAAIALMMAVAMTPGSAPILGMVVIPSTVVGLAAYFGCHRLIDLFYGPRCPSCGVRALERKALMSFGERYFLCNRCGVRCRRSLLDTLGMFRWRDASGPEYESMFQKPREEDPWNGPPGLEDEDEQGLYSKTHLNLVRSKRIRKPENPNGPGLE